MAKRPESVHVFYDEMWYSPDADFSARAHLPRSIYTLKEARRIFKQRAFEDYVALIAVLRNVIRRKTPRQGRTLYQEKTVLRDILAQGPPKLRQLQIDTEEGWWIQREDSPEIFVGPFDSEEEAWDDYEEWEDLNR